MSGCKRPATAVLRLLLLPAVAAAAVLQRTTLRRLVAPDPVVGNPANSATIEGPDCGNVKQIIPQWFKAKQVGQVAGRAQGIMANAKAIAGGLDAASAKVREAGKVIGENGEPPAAIAAAADSADQASGAITAAAAALETKLGTFKTAVGATEMSGESVTDVQVVEIKDLTTELEAAAKAAQVELKALMKKAEEVHAEALKNSDTASRLINSALDSAMPLLKDAPDVMQKAKWAVQEAEAAVSSADKAASEIVPSTAAEQAPVVQAAKDNLLSEKQAVADAHPKVTTAISELDTAITALKTKVQPLQDAKQAAAGGGVLKSTNEDLTAAGKAEADVRLALEKLRGVGGTLMKRKGRLDATLAKLATTTTTTTTSSATTSSSS